MCTIKVLPTCNVAVVILRQLKAQDHDTIVINVFSNDVYWQSESNTQQRGDVAGSSIEIASDNVYIELLNGDRKDLHYVVMSKTESFHFFGRFVMEVRIEYADFSFIVKSGLNYHYESVVMIVAWTWM